MSVVSELRDVKEEHEEMRVHLTPEQNRGLDESANSAGRWLKAGYGAFGLMVVALFALWLS